MTATKMKAMTTRRIAPESAREILTLVLDNMEKAFLETRGTDKQEGRRVSDQETVTKWR